MPTVRGWRRLLVAVLWLPAAGCGEPSRLNARCLAGDVASCTRLGDMYAFGQGVERDLGRAGEAYARACDGGAYDVCNTLGEMHAQSGPLEDGRSEALFQRACEGGSSAGCLNLGLAFAGREDYVHAVSLFERSCAAGWAPGCQQLGHSYEAGEGVRADGAKALAWYGQACDGGLVDGCVSAGTLHLAGTLVAADPASAQQFFGRAAAILDESCQSGVERDCAERDRLRARAAIAQAAAAQAGR